VKLFSFAIAKKKIGDLEVKAWQEY
jgi:hypothetical protein